jgi:hypothetical protein
VALTRTFLTAAIKANDLVLNVASTATGFPPLGILGANHQPVLVDNELMFIYNVPVAGQLIVRGRGSDGTQAVAHDINASVVTSTNPADFPANPVGLSTLHPPSFPDAVTYGQSGAITIPVKDTKIFLAGTTAMTMTLAAPSFALKGVELFITSETAQAHVLSAPLLLDTGAAGSPFSTATFPAQLGVSLILILQNGLYNVQAVNGTIVFA